MLNIDTLTFIFSAADADVRAQYERSIQWDNSGHVLTVIGHAQLTKMISVKCQTIPI